jgi:hypothetical protein
MENINDDYEQMKAYFELQSKHVQTHAKIVDTDLVGQDYMLHIDRARPKMFVPRMPKTGPEEANETTPRVTVCANLLGCYIGYNRGESDFELGSSNEVMKDEGYRGGYEICKIEFKHCLQPNDELICEASRSLEYWLVPYNQDTLEYSSVEVGKMFLTEIKHTAKTGKVPNVWVSFHIEVSDEKGFPFNANVYLNKGYYKIELEWLNMENRDTINLNHLKVESISKEDYEATKTLSAALLHHTQAKKPDYFSW